MKQITSNYKGNHKSMYIVAISDLHIGHKSYQEKYLNDVIGFISKNKNRCRIVLLGDLLETATKTSVGAGPYEESFHTQQQLDKAIEIFKPYKDLIDMVIIGNHELRVFKDTSIDLMKNFSQSLGIVDRYVQYDGILNINVGGCMYAAYAAHGSTGGTKESSAINSMLNMRERAFAHLYMQGHTHKLLSFTRKIYLPTVGNEAAEMEQLFVNTGSALGDEGYPAMKGLPPSSLGFGYIELFGGERRMEFHKI